MAATFGLSGEYQQGKVNRDALKTTSHKLNLSKEGFDKIVQDIMGQEQGLTQLLQGEGTAGLYGSSTETLLAQRFATNLAGELAKLTAEDVTTTKEDETTRNKQMKASGGIGTVICSELVRLGYLDRELYLDGGAHFLKLHPQVVRGYRVWANKIVPLMASRPWLCKFFLPIARTRYEHITGKRKNLAGLLSVLVAEPICYLIGFFVPKEDNQYGYAHPDY